MALSDTLRHLNDCVERDDDSENGGKGEVNSRSRSETDPAHDGPFLSLWRRAMNRCYVAAHLERDKG